MKHFMKILSYIVLSLFLMVALSGCKKTESVDPKTKEIIVWSFEDEDVWKPIAKNFATKYKGYTLKYVKQNFDNDYENRALNAILSDQGPDVWSMPNDWVYRHKDKLAPITKQSANIDHYNQSLVGSVVFNDKVYALSSYTEPLTIYYNAKLLDQTLADYNEANPGSENAEDRKEAARLLKDVPLTWTDFSKAVNLITKKDSKGNIEVAGTAMGTSKVSNASDILYLLMLQNDTKILADDMSQATFHLPLGTPKDTSDIPGLRAMEFYTSFADPSSDNYAWDDSLGNDIDAFANGKVGMIFGYSSLQNYLAQKYPNTKYRRAAVPQLVTDPAKFVDYSKFNVFGVTELTAKYKDKTKACWNLINLLADGQSSDSFNSAMRVYTSAKGSGETSLENRNTSSPDKVELLTAKSLVKGRYPVEFDKTIKNAISSVNEGTQDPKAALDAAASSVTELLRKVGWQ